MAETKNQEPSGSSGLGGLGGAAALLGLGAAGSAALGGGSKAFRPKAGSRTEAMAPGKQALLAFILDVLLQRLNQTGGVNQSFASYLQNGPQRMPPLDPSAMASLREAIRQPGAFDSRTREMPARPSTFQDVAQGIGGVVTLAGALDKLGRGRGGGVSTDLTANALLDGLLGPTYRSPSMSGGAVADSIRSNPDAWSFSMPDSQGASGGGSWLGNFLGSWV